MAEIFLISLLRERVPTTPAIVYKGQTMTVGELLRESEQLAAGLQKLGIKHGDTAVLAAMPDAGFIKIVYAAMICGLRLAVIDPEMGRDNYRENCANCNPAGLLWMPGCYFCRSILYCVGLISGGHARVFISRKRLV